MNTQDTPIKYFSYVRKSSEGKEKQALSIPAQKEKTLEQFPALDIEFIDEEKSAFIPYNRPKFEDMLARIKKGERTGLIVWHPDRLSRNEIDASQITYYIRTGLIQDLKFCTYHFENSPEGIWMLQMALSQSQYESAKKGRDVKRGMEKKVKMGWNSGIAPAGYINEEKMERGETINIIAEDEQRFPLIQKMWQLMLTGHYSAPQLLEIVNNKWGYRSIRRKNSGGTPLSRTSIYKILTSPFYYGWFEYPAGSGKWYKGSHKPMVTQDEFEKVQILLGRHGRPVPRAKSFAFTGLIQCAHCRCSITAEEKHQAICTECKTKFSYGKRTTCPRCQTALEHMQNPTILKYVYYRCTRKNKAIPCRQPGIEVQELAAQLMVFLLSIQVCKSVLDYAFVHLQKTVEHDMAVNAAEIASLKSAQAEAVKRLQTLLDMRLSNEITADEFTIKKSVLIQERNRYEGLLRDADGKKNEWLELSKQCFTSAHYGASRFLEALQHDDVQAQREVVTSLGSNLLLKDKILNIEATEPYRYLQKFLVAVPEAKHRLEPIKEAVDKRVKSSYVVIGSRLLPIVDKIRTYFKHNRPPLKIYIKKKKESTN